LQEQVRKSLESALGGKKNEFEKWNKEIKRRERRWVEVVMLVEVVGLDGVDGLVGPTVTISGKKHNKQFLRC
jgi:hypothetical protein